MTDYQLSLVDEMKKLGRMEYRTLPDDAAAMRCARELLGEWERITVSEGVRFVGVVVHPSHQIRA